jgi:hypothetical protein
LGAAISTTKWWRAFYRPKTRIRLTGGHLYQRLFISDRDLSDDSFMLLRDKSTQSYRYLSSNFGSTLKKAPEVFLDVTEEKMFTAWFPIQKDCCYGNGPRHFINARERRTHH